MKSNMILGDMGSYIANRAWNRDEYRLDTPEVEPEVINATPKPASLPVQAGLEAWVQRVYRSLFNSKVVEDGKIRP